MADRTSSTIMVRAAKSEIMAVIADFAAYPQWTGAIKEAQVLETGPDGLARRVRFALDGGVFKDSYVLAYAWSGDDEVRWEMAEPGTVLSGMTGAYRLASREGGTEVTYELAVSVKIPMIGMVRRKAEKVIIDTALKGLKQRVERRGEGRI